eukprot:6008405-Prymnesium_polylepis.2
MRRPPSHSTCPPCQQCAGAPHAERAVSKLQSRDPFGSNIQHHVCGTCAHIITVVGPPCTGDD